MTLPPAGALVDLVIALTIVEGAALYAWHATTGRGPAIGLWLPNLVSGLCLLGALRTVLHHPDAGWLDCAPWLTAAGIAHALDLWRRWPSRDRQTTTTEGTPSRPQPSRPA